MTPKAPAPVADGRRAYSHRSSHISMLHQPNPPCLTRRASLGHWRTFDIEIRLGRCRWSIGGQMAKPPIRIECD